MNGGASDEELMSRYQNGDIKAFELLYARHKGGMFRYFLRQTDEGVAAELHQDVWLKLVRNHEHYRPDARFTTYLYSIARNRLIDHHRTSKRRIPDLGKDDCSEQLPAPTNQDPAIAAERREQVDTLLAGIAGLPAVQQEVFLLREEAGLGMEDIAAVTGANVETVKSRLRYAVNKLRQCLQEPVNVR